MEPYREDKPWIRFNPDAMKQSILETILSIPGARAIKYYHDNPEGSAAEFVDLLAEDIVPEYRNLIKPALRGEDIDWKDAAKEAAIYGIPMPYTRFPKGHPKAGEAIPNTIKDAYPSNASYRSAMYLMRNNKRKLYSSPDQIIGGGTGHRLDDNTGLSTRTRVDANAILRDPLQSQPIVNLMNRTGTASDIVNTTGTTALGTNTRAYESGRNHGATNGGMGWQGEMYGPGRVPVNIEMNGPFQWEDKYSRKLDNLIGDNENRWNFMINETRPNKMNTQVPKDNMIAIALQQGRPDIATRIALDSEPRINISKGPKYASYYTTLNKNLGMDRKKFMDISNRAVEKELRETFATLPDDPAIRQRFADYYGVHDLYDDWINNKAYWDEYTTKVKRARNLREAQNRTHDRRYGRNIER